MGYQPSVRDIILAFFRRKTLFMLVCGAVFLAGGAYLLLKQPLYQSTASLVLHFDTQTVPNIDRTMNPTQPLGSNEHREILYSDSEIMRSTGVIHGVITAVGLARLYPQIAASQASDARKLDLATESLLANLVVDVGLQSDVLNINYFNPDPTVARAQRSRRHAPLRRHECIEHGADIGSDQRDERDPGCLPRAAAAARSRRPAARRCPVRPRALDEPVRLVRLQFEAPMDAAGEGQGNRGVADQRAQHAVSRGRVRAERRQSADDERDQAEDAQQDREQRHMAICHTLRRLAMGRSSPPVMLGHGHRPRDRHHPGFDRAERAVRDERAGPGLGPPRPPCGAGAQRRAGSRARTGLADDPQRFLPTVQVGITLVGMLAGVFGGARIANHLAAWLTNVPALRPVAETLSLALVVVVMTYLTLVLGELVPKQLALRRPEHIAARVAPAIAWIARVTSPVVWLLDSPRARCCGCSACIVRRSRRSPRRS